MDFDNEEEELAIFEDLFYRDLESWWDSSGFYCDSCYGSFVDAWPLAYSAKAGSFQRRGMGLDTFFAGGRLRDVFSKADFQRLVAQLQCPNCGSSLKGNIWAYELPFSLPPDFHIDVEEVGRLAQVAPFLLLTNPLCKEVFELVGRLARATPTLHVNEKLYRARRLSEGKVLEQSPTSFDFPPRDVVSEGRYNHAGRPVLYLASSIGTCIAETRDVESLVVSFFLRREIKILDLIELVESGDREHELLSALSYSSLASAPENGKGWDKPAYVFTRFVADCAFYSGFDAIRYSSTRLGLQDESYNLVLFNRDWSIATHGADFEYELYSPSLLGAFGRQMNGPAIR